jgi:hypothetical protein
MAEKHDLRNGRAGSFIKRMLKNATREREAGIDGLNILLINRD